MIRMRSSRKYFPAGQPFTRRQFGAVAAGTGLALFQAESQDPVPTVPVGLARGTDRKSALKSAFELLGTIDLEGRKVYLKGSYNSPDPYPAITHPVTLTTVIELLRERNCGSIVLVERSGMGSAARIWEQFGIPALSKRLGFSLLDLAEIPAEGWRPATLPGSHWKRGVEIPRMLDDGAAIVQITNMKTHRFGGLFAGSLKNSIGLLPKYSHDGSRYNFMQELHASPDQRLMIAEVNQLYQPALVFLDAAEIFVAGGPEKGDLAFPEAFAVSRDRVAIDAIGIGLLRMHEAGPPFQTTNVFEHEQLKRAVELKLGVGTAAEIEFRTRDERSKLLSSQIRTAINQVSDEQKPEGKRPEGKKP
jgi:uncharacterized protein (DUF362 family)